MGRELEEEEEEVHLPREENWRRRKRRSIYEGKRIGGGRGGPSRKGRELEEEEEEVHLGREENWMRRRRSI